MDLGGVGGDTSGAKPSIRVFRVSALHRLRVSGVAGRSCGAELAMRDHAARCHQWAVSGSCVAARLNLANDSNGPVATQRKDGPRAGHRGAAA